MYSLPTFFNVFRRLRTFWLTLFCGLLLTQLAALWINDLIKRDSLAVLGQMAGMAGLQVENRLAAQAEVLRGLQGVFVANPNLDRASFREILDSQNILSRLPGFVAIGFARSVPREELNRFLAATRNFRGIGQPAYQEYSIHPLTGQPYTLPIDFLYPINASTISYLGLDLLSITDNRAALSTSRDEGRGIASPPLPLGGAADKTPSILVHYPVYSAGLKPLTVAERQQRYLGSLTAIYRIDQVLSSIESSLMSRLGRTRLYDTGGALDRSGRRPEQLLFETFRTQAGPAELCASRIINLPGRQWRLEACSAQWQISPHRQESLWLCWLIGGSFALLFGGVLQMRKKSQDLANQLAEDITADLRKHESRHRKLEMLTNEARDIIVVRDTRGRIEYANPAAQRRFHQDGRLLEQSTEPLLVSAELSELSEPMVVPCSHRDPLGGICHYEAMLVPMRDPYGKYMGSAMLARDVTRRIEQSEELRKTNARLADLLELSSDWLWEQDAESRFTHISGGYFKVRDVNPAHLIGRSRWELGHAGLTEAEWEAHRKAIEEHRPYRDFVFNLRGGRESIVVSVSGKPVFDDAGYFIGYRGVGHDITALHQAKMQAQSEKQRVLATLESLSDGIITTDLAGRIDYMNPVAIALTGRELQEAEGQPVEMIFQVVDQVTRLPLPSLPRQVLANNDVPIRYRNAVLLNRFGLTFTIQEAIACIRDDKGDVMGSVVVFRDLSDWIGQSANLPSPGAERN